MKKLAPLLILASALVACKEQPKTAATTHAAAVMFVVGNEAKIVSEKGQTKAVKGAILQQGDSIQTGPKSQVDIMLPGKILIRIDQNTTVAMRSFATAADGSQADKLYLQRGLIFAKVTKLGQHSTFAIQTPTIVAGVRGTEFLTATDEKGAGKVAVTEGKVAVQAGQGAEQAIDAGQQANVSESGSVAPGKIDDATAAQMKQLSTVANISAQQAQIFEDALKQQKEALEKAGGTDKIQKITEENDKKMQEKRDEEAREREMLRQADAHWYKPSSASSQSTTQSSTNVFTPSKKESSFSFQSSAPASPKSSENLFIPSKSSATSVFKNGGFSFR